MLTRFAARGCHALAILLLAGNTGWTQEGGGLPLADKTFQELLADWAVLEQQLINREKEFNETEDFRVKDELKNRYIDLVKNANDVIESLRAAGLAALDQDGADRALVTRTLLGIMVNDASLGLDQRVLELGQALIARQIDPRYFQRAAELERLSLKQREVFEELQVRQREALADDLPRVKLETTQGDIVIELFENEAPLAVANFVYLVEQGFYDGIAFHRVLEGFVAQAGDATSAGRSGVDYTIPGEAHVPEARRHFTGSVAMALLGNDVNSGNSQFYLAYSRQTTMALDGKHTVFGRVIEGWDVASKLTPTARTIGMEEVPNSNAVPDKINKAVVLRKRPHEYRPTKVGESAPAEHGSDPPIDPPVTDQGGGEGDASDGG